MVVDVIAILCIILSLPHFITTRNWIMIALCVVLFILIAINRRLKDHSDD